MTDQVRVQNLCLHGFHGVLPQETELGQKFYVDITCDLDLAPCAVEDDYTKAVCYGALCDVASDVSDAGPYQLIETLGDRICAAVLERFDRVDHVSVTVRKPSAPLKAQFDHVSVTINRKRRYRVGISLGSNMGDKIANLRTALMRMNTLPGFEVDQVSSFYQTEPWGNTDQDWFLNACLTGWTTLAPLDLLKALKRTEVELGRVPAVRWGPRAIDLDLLFSEDLEIDSKLLTLPHPEMFNRAFVLVPLAEIAGDHKVLGQSIADGLKALEYDPNEIVALQDE